MSSTISGNTSLLEGGGVLDYKLLMVVNSTLSANTATAGAALFNGGQAYITNATLSGNANTYAGYGSFVNFGSAQVRNTIMANTTAGFDCSAAASG